MTPFPILRSATLCALLASAVTFTVSSAARAQDAPRQLPFDTAARGRRDGLTAADTTSVAGYRVMGVLTGFIAGVVGPPVWAHNESRTAGALTLIPFTWAVVVAGRKSRAAPPPTLAARIETQPEAYQDPFRAAHAQRLAQRRRRAMITAGIVGTIVGFAALVGLAAAALSTAGT
jgi:hypothetical protein